MVLGVLPFSALIFFNIKIYHRFILTRGRFQARGGNNRQGSTTQVSLWTFCLFKTNSIWNDKNRSEERGKSIVKKVRTGFRFFSFLLKQDSKIVTYFNNLDKYYILWDTWYDVCSWFLFKCNWTSCGDSIVTNKIQTKP